MRRPLLLTAFAAALEIAGLPGPASAQTWELAVENLVSSFRVGTSQTSLKALQVTNGQAAAAQAAAAALTSQDNALRIARAQHTYGYDTGTGYAACSVALGMADERDAYASAQKVRDAFRQADRNWLTAGGDRAARISASLKQRREFYCTQAEQDAQWCTAPARGGGLGGGDSDAAPWLFNRSYGAEEVATAADYLDVIAPLPTVQPNPQTAQQDIDLVVARRQGAIISGARSTLIGVISVGMGGDRRSDGATP